MALTKKPKKEYMQRIYLRADENIVKGFKYIYLVDAKNGGLSWVTANSITQLRMHNKEPKYFATLEEAEKCKRIMDFHYCEIVSKWVPKPVSSAQRNLSKQYCQTKRQLAGIASMMQRFCTSKYTRASLLNIVEEESFYLDKRYEAALKEIKEKKND